MKDDEITMATIKGYTNIEQSRKLAEILPLESADMYYFDDNGGEPNFKVRNGITYYYDNEDFLCCWSLAALIDVLPNENMLVKTTDGEYYCLSKDVMTKHYNNPVDACVAMIEKLHELNLL